MSENDFILDNIKFSYSGVSSFHICKFMYKLTYIECKERISGWFSDYGLFCHKILEKYFKGELETWDLAKYYEDNYGKEIVTAPPPYPVSMPESYYNAGLKFFTDFDFDKDLYDVLVIEEPVDAEYNGIRLVIKPDLVLREKSTQECILIDFKTAKPKTVKKDREKQLKDFKNQFNLYSYFLWTEKNIQIKKIKIWFIRNGTEEVINVDPFEVQSSLDWFEDTIKNIKLEDKWEPNLDKSNEYFCSQICSMRGTCSYRNA